MYCNNDENDENDEHKKKKKKLFNKNFQNKTSKIDKIKKYYEKINSDPEKVKLYVRNKIVDILSQSDKSRFQLEDYLFKRIKKEEHELLVNEILDHYEDLNYINDNRFLENYIRYKYEQGIGKTRIINELKEKGLKCINTINEQFNLYDFEKSLIEYVERKYLSKTNIVTRKEYDKIIRQLITKGYSFSDLNIIKDFFEVGKQIEKKGVKNMDAEKLLNKLTRKGYGLNKIKQEFKQKEVMLTENMIESVDFYEIAKEYKIKKFGEENTSDKKQKQKETNHLLGRGFSFDEIKEAYL